MLVALPPDPLRGQPISLRVFFAENMMNTDLVIKKRIDKTDGLEYVHAEKFCLRLIAVHKNRIDREPAFTVADFVIHQILVSSGQAGQVGHPDKQSFRLLRGVCRRYPFHKML